MSRTKLCAFFVGFAILALGSCAEPTGDATGSGDTGDANVSEDASETEAEQDSSSSTSESSDTTTETDTGDGDSGTSDEPSDCDGSWAFVLKPDPSQVASFMLVVDRSGSMNEYGRWESTLSALTGVTEALEGFVDFGLMLFPNEGIDACGAGRVLVEPGPNNAAAIRTQLEGSTPLGGTPTAVALEDAGAWLSETNPNGSNYILLATDGGPGCNAGMDPNTCECIPGANCECPFGGSLCEMAAQNCLDSVRTANQVLVQRENGINTFVVGIPGSEVVSDLLDTMAIAGGTAVNGQHYAVTNETELIDALSSASGSTIPCEFPMDTVPEDLSSLEVVLDGQAIVQDETHTNGWDVTGDTLRLYGAACSTMRNGQPHELRVAFSCD